MITFDCEKTGYERELYIAKVIDWLYAQHGYVRNLDYQYDWNFSMVTFWAKPGKEALESLVALRYVK